MANANDITESIMSLRAESSPSSVTPERVGSLLQAIVDLIKALSMVPEEEVVSIMQAVNNALSTAQAANATAANALTSANNKHIDSVTIDRSSAGMTIKIKQTGHSAKSADIPLVDASNAGVMSPAMLQRISALEQGAENNKLNTITRQYSEHAMLLTFLTVNEDPLCTLLIPYVGNKAGLMTAEAKSKLDSLPDGGVVALDAAGRVPAGQSPQVMLRRCYPSSYDSDPLMPGEFCVDGGAESSTWHIYYIASATENIDMGVPSKNVIYCETETNILYRWTGSEFVPTLNDPNYAMKMQSVTRNNNTQKRYTVPNGILANMVITTDVVNIVLSPANTGASVHRLLFRQINLGIAENINWPSGICWAGGSKPDLATIESCDGCLVTIYDGTFAEFKYFGL